MSSKSVGKTETYDDVNDVWFMSSMLGISQRIQQLKYAVRKPESLMMLHKIIQQFNDTTEAFLRGVMNTSQIASFSVYTHLLEEYEESGAICHLHELSERMNAYSRYAEIQKDALPEDVTVSAL